MPTARRKDRVERFISVLEESTNRLWGAHIRVPPSIAGKFSRRRVVCILNGSVPYQCAILHRGEDLFLVTVNKARRTTLGLSFGMKVRVGIESDRSTYGLPIPTEMKELLRQDRKGSRLFHALTPGRQRTLLHIVGNVKSPEKRMFRAMVVVNHLKDFNGRIDYRPLAKALRQRHSQLAGGPA